MTVEERAQGNAVGVGIDRTLRSAADEAGVEFVSPYRASADDVRPAFAGHSLCESGAPYYRGIDALLRARKARKPCST